MRSKRFGSKAFAALADLELLVAIRRHLRNLHRSSGLYACALDSFCHPLVIPLARSAKRNFFDYLCEPPREWYVVGSGCYHVLIRPRWLLLAWLLLA